MKKLYRSEKNKIIFGILGGVGEYFEIDPVIVRLIFVLLTLMSGLFPGLLFYIVSVLIVPRR